MKPNDGWRPSSPALRFAVVALAVGNLAALWVKRGHFVGGWELFGPTFGILALNEGSFTDALRTIATSYLTQRQRLGYTGAESFVYTLIPGGLDSVAPWLLWSQLLTLALMVAFSWWLARRLAIRPTVLVATALSSAALTSYVIVGYPYLPSTAIPYGLAIVWVLSDRRRSEHPAWGATLDVLAFAAITVIAYDGYEIGKTFFVVPFVAAFTVPGVSVVRRATWLVLAIGLAGLGVAMRPMSSLAALDAVPHDLSYLTGLLAIAKRYFVDWYVDFPAIGVAAVLAVLGLRERRAFWVALLVVSTGVLTLSAFQFEGKFIIPQRFLLFACLAAVVTSLYLSRDAERGWRTTLVVLLIAIGIAHTSFVTVHFLQEQPTSTHRDYNVDPVYALPYQRARLDWHVWRDRVHDAEIVSRMLRDGSEAHVFFYGFSVVGEDPVNPQVFPSRILVNVGWKRFDRLVRFFDHASHMWFQFPIASMSDVDETLSRLTPPFYVHVKEPEHSAADLIARHLNRATVAPVDLGLEMLTSYEVTDYEPPGPMPVSPLTAEMLPASDLSAEPAGFCRTSWTPDRPGESSITHLWVPLARRLDDELRSEPAGRARHDVVSEIRDQMGEPTVIHYRGYLDGSATGSRVVAIDLDADDEVAVLANGHSVFERLRAGARVRQHLEVAFPDGAARLDVLYRKYWNEGGIVLTAAAPDGAPLEWRCPADQTP